MEIEMKPERNPIIDIAKGIGIIFVVFAHVNYTPWLLQLIYSFHMPLFFIISGMLFKREKYSSFSEFLKRRWKTLIIPYLIFSIGAIGYVFALEHVFPEILDISREQYINYVKQIVLAQGSAPVLNTPLWFIPCLFAVEIIYFLISKFRIKVRVVLCFALVCAGWFLESGKLAFDNTLLPWSLDSALFALGFYAFGNLAAEYMENTMVYLRNHKNKRVLCAIIFILCFTIWFPAMNLNGKITLGSKILNNGFLLYLTGITGTWMIFCISLLLEKNKFLDFCGRNSFCIMSVHYVIRKYTIPKYYQWIEIPLYKRKVLKETIVPFLIIFGLSILFTWTYNKLRKKVCVKCC